MGGGYIGTIGRNLGQITVAGLISVAMKIRNDDIANENLTTINRFRTTCKEKLLTLKNQKRILFNSREEFHDPVRRFQVEQQLKEAKAHYLKVDSWMSSQNDMFPRFFRGPIQRMPFFHEQEENLENKLFELEDYLANLAKEDMLGSNSKALVPYVIPKTLGFDFNLSEIVGIWV